MRYKTVYADTPKKLDKKVNKLLELGWVLYGNMQVHASFPDFGIVKNFYQNLIKNEFNSIGWNETMLHCTICSGKLLESNKVLLSHPKQFQYKCRSCTRRYLKTEGENNLSFHFDQIYGGE